MSSGSGERLIPKNEIDSQVIDDTSRRENVGASFPLKKGPWTSAEDAILVEYIKRYGEGNWNAVQKNSELVRCGKSCRLRWSNHLRPDLKKGAFDPEEELLIIELHAKMEINGLAWLLSPVNPTHSRVIGKVWEERNVCKLYLYPSCYKRSGTYL